jgi:hypothetical protein
MATFFAWQIQAFQFSTRRHRNYTGAIICRNLFTEFSQRQIRLSDHCRTDLRLVVFQTAFAPARMWQGVTIAGLTPFAPELSTNERLT